jgi:C4-dicarboxylate-specific signal transduction histidine kinase
MSERKAVIRTWKAPFRYLVAIVLVLAALLLSLALEEPFENPSWFLFPAAILASTWICGNGPGWLAVLLSTFTAQFFFIPPLRSWILRPGDVPFFISFILCEVVANRMIAWRIRTENALRDARDGLEIRVAERTAALETANQSLQKQMIEQRRTEEALQTARTELARVMRITTVGELAASIAHEVNQPLAAVVANADACVAWLTRQNPDSAEAQAAALRAVAGATRASEVIARIRSLISKGTPTRTGVNLNRVIEETVALTAEQAARHNTMVAVDLDRALPNVAGDRIQLQQVILNLIVNGIEAMAAVTERERKLTVRSRCDSDRGVHVLVEDSGIGVDSEMLPRIFEPFYTTRAQGIGMGLAISHSIVEAHGGRLWAASVVNHGSIFQFVLPVEEGSAP